MTSRIFSSLRSEPAPLLPSVSFGPRAIAKGIWSHAGPIAGTLALLLTGLAFTFGWDPVVYHLHEWITPDDLWSTFRDAHYVGWGSEGVIYDVHTGLVTFPGIAVLLTPLALLQGPLHLSSSVPWYLVRPSEWYVLGPVDIMLGGFLLFPLDALAKYLDLPARRRAVLVVLEAVLIWPVVVIWGHPEDTVALGLALYGVLATFKGSWLRAGFILGFAVAFQPLTLLALPIAFTLIPLRHWPVVLGEIALPSSMLLLAPLIKEWGPTTRSLLNQPNEPSLNHPTPWLALAPRLATEHYVSNFTIQQTTLANGSVGITQHNKGEASVHLVAAGPERIVALLLAVVIGVYLLRRRPSAPLALWWIAVALSLRCVFESVLTPYYLVPSLVVALLVALQATPRRLTMAVVAAALCTYVSYLFLNEWEYYLLVIGLLLITVALAFPTSTRPDSANSGSLSSDDSHDSSMAPARSRTR
jgi:hypothetical protein